MLAGLRGGVQIVGLYDAPPPYDVQAPLLSLPHLLGGGAPVVPTGGAYLDPDRDRAARWRDRLAGLQRSIMLSVNQEYVDRKQTLNDGDEVALITPVSGGSGT